MRELNTRYVVGLNSLRRFEEGSVRERTEEWMIESMSLQYYCLQYYCLQHYCLQYWFYNIKCLLVLYFFIWFTSFGLLLLYVTSMYSISSLLFFFSSLLFFFFSLLLSLSRVRFLYSLLLKRALPEKFTPGDF